MNFLKSISTRNWIIIAVVVLVIILIIYFATRKKTITTTTPAPVKTSGYGFGDNIYAKENAVNSYKTASATSGNLASYKGYAKDSFIGTYLSKESGFIKVLILNPASSVFVLSTQVYSK